MNRSRYLRILPLCFFLYGMLSLCSCRKGEMLVESSPSFYRTKRNIQKVISINPEYQVISQKESGVRLVELSRIMQAQFLKQLDRNAKKFDLDLRIYDPSIPDNQTQDYFNDLLPLKRAVMKHIQLQGIEAKAHHKNRKFSLKPYSRQFQTIFQLPTHFSHLATKYGTPYFALHGLIAGKAKGDKMLYYTIWINVESSEIVYREIRVLENKARPLILDAIIYDSFHIALEL